MAKKNHGSDQQQKSRGKSRKDALSRISSASRDTQNVTYSAEAQGGVSPHAQSGITRKAGDTSTQKQGALGAFGRAVSSVRRLFSRSKNNVVRTGGTDVETPIPTVSDSSRGVNKAGRGARRESDVPMDRLAASYTPTQTSLKASFRADGADQQRDQEFAAGVADDRWNEEDRFTNKSGDPRIGTHKRTYEPGEAQMASRDEE